MKRIWIAAGGTGGHIAPCAAMIENIPKNYHFTCFTLKKNLNYPDIQNMKKENVKIYPASKIPRSFFSFFSFLKGTFLSLKILNTQYKQNKPNAILAFGGYPVFPILLFSIWKKIPFFLFEQNSIYGMVTRLFHKRAISIFISYPKESINANEKLTGNPIREKIRNKISGKNIAWPPKKILITGGSQGAKDLNDLFILMTKDSFFDPFQITIATGSTHYEKIIPYKKANTEIFPFIHNIHEYLNQCDLILCRSGSGTVFETAMAQKPAIFFPYPFATDNHQVHNAMPLKEAGLAELIDERPFLPHIALEKIKPLLQKDSILSNATKNYEKKNPLPLDAHSVTWEIIQKYLEHSDEK